MAFYFLSTFAANNYQTGKMLRERYHLNFLRNFFFQKLDWFCVCGKPLPFQDWWFYITYFLTKKPIWKRSLSRGSGFSLQYNGTKVKSKSLTTQQTNACLKSITETEKGIQRYQ